MNRLFLIIPAFFVLITKSALSQQVLSLEQSIEIAIRNNIEVAQLDLLSDIAGINLKQAKFNRLPTINGNITHGINQGRSIDPFTNSYANQKINYASYGIGGDIVLFNGFSLKHAVKQNAFAYDASKMDLQQAKDNLELAVILAYLQVLSNEDQVELATQQVGVTQAQVDRLEKLNQQGAISPPELYDLRGQLKEAELNKINALNAVATAKLLLTQLLTIPNDPSLKLVKIDRNDLLEAFPETVDEIYNNAVNNLAVIKAEDFRKKSAEAAIRVSRGNMFPTLALGSNINTNYSSAASREVFTGVTEQASSNYVLINGVKQPVIVPRQNFNVERINYSSQFQNNVFSNIGIGLRVPIFNSFFNRNRVKLAKIQVDLADLTLNNTRIMLRQEIDQAYVNMNNAFERYKILIEQVAAYNESFRAAEVRFNAGVGTSVDYIIAKGNLDRANINLVTAQYDYLLRRKILQFYNER
jgi:outer membrane protein